MVAPLLILLLIGILQVGLAVNAFVTVGNASAEGAHYAALNPAADLGEIAATVRGRVVPLETSRLQVSAFYDDGSGLKEWPAGGIPESSPKLRRIPIRVEVTYPWSPLALIARFLPNGSGTTFTSAATAETLR